jgi:putative ABC transport system ATP-binding protein
MAASQFESLTPVKVGPFNEDTLYVAISRIALSLQIVIDRSEVDFAEPVTGDSPSSELADPCVPLVSGARQVGIYLKEFEPASSGELMDLIREGYPLVLALPGGKIKVMEKMVGRRVESSTIEAVGGRVTGATKSDTISQSGLRSLLFRQEKGRLFVAKKELECDTFSAGGGGGHHGGHGGGGNGHGAGHVGGHHEHLSPIRRFFSLLKLDYRDIFTIIVFAVVAGILSLATPLAIESMVNVVSWGTYVQPLLVIALMLFACLSLGGFLKILQTVLVEIIQRRQLVRIVGDLSHRFPRANQPSLAAEYPRELANRVFDIMTIQKATAVLLMDGVTIVLTTILGLLLLGFYHPFLLGFDIALILSMVFVTWVLGRGGVRTAIAESIVKYRIAHWLQDVIASPSAFKINGGEGLAVERANRLASEYIDARRLQFRVVLRQIAFAIGLQVFASTAVLGLGGWLVIQGQLTLGQLVASELIVTVVLGAFAKAGKSLEKYYDLMAGIDKVGHLLDVEVDPRFELGSVPDGPAEVRWDDLDFPTATGSTHVPAAYISPGSIVGIVGDNVTGKSMLAKSLVGLVAPHHGVVEVAGLDAAQASYAGGGRMVAYAGEIEIFRSTLTENIDLGRGGIGQNRVRESLQMVGLWDDVLRLPGGVQTTLQTGGFPLTELQSQQLMIARAISGLPRLLIINGLLDEMVGELRDQIWQQLSSADRPWTLILATNDPELASKCDQQIAVRD